MAILERSSELDALFAAAARAREGAGQLVLLSGEAGLGKTSLIEEVSRVQDPRFRVAVSHCEPVDLAGAFGPLPEIARTLGGGLPALFSDGDAPPRLADVLEELKHLAPALLVIEDAHWADQFTLDFIRYLGRRVEQLPTLVVVTHRDDELGAAHPLRPVLGALATSRSIVRIRLSPLSRTAVEQLASDTAHDGASVHALTGGNPFFVREVLREPHTSSLPRAVRDLVAGRMARLGAGAQALVRLVAVGGRVPFAWLGRAGDGAADDIEAAEAAGLVRWADREVVLRHDLTRTAVLEASSPAQLAAAHGRLLGVLQALETADPASLAQHAIGAGASDAILRYGPIAARAAAARGAHRQAVAFYDAVLQQTPAQPPAPRAALLEAYAQSLAAIDDQPRAIEALAAAHDLYRKAGEALKAGACLGALALPHARLGQNLEAERTCQAAIAELERWGDTAQLAEALRIRAHLRMLDRDTGQALHFGNRAIRMARELKDDATSAAAHMTVGATLLVSDDPRGRRHIDHALHLARELGRQDLESIALVNAGSAYGEQFRFSDAEPFLVEGIALAEAHDLDTHAWYLRAWQALVRLHQGRLREATALAGEVVRAPDVSALSRIMGLVALGRATARLGGDGSACLDEALALAEPTATLQRLAPVRLARAEAAWLGGDLERCLAEAEAVWRLTERHRHQWLGGEVVFWRHLCGAPSDPPAWIAPPYALQAQGRWREAADAWAALGCPFEQARALGFGDVEARQSALRIYDELGAATAAAALRRSLRQAGVRQVSRGPRAPTKENAWGLTGRQQEIAALLAEGLSNKHISRALRISPKTVETHLSAIFAKLEVATRQEARARLAASSAPAGP